VEKRKKEKWRGKKRKRGDGGGKQGGESGPPRI